MSELPSEYAIVDLETTGGFGDDNRITEIAIIVTNGKEILQEYSTLINPERSIPSFVAGLTGITDSMVEDAPKFYEVAKEVYQILDEKVFVAHNVSFDATVLREEYKSLGGKFNPKKLCTVRLSRSSFPGYKSYSLGNICQSLEIPLQDRHRAMGDAKATYYLFKKILDKNPEGIVASLNARSKETTLPPNLKREAYDKLPDDTGVYYFLNENKEIIYVGKAINIKDRINSHFSKKDNKSKTLNFRAAIHDIDFTITGSELLALLHESAEIKHHLPLFNRAQRRTTYPVGLYKYKDKAGYIRFAINRIANNLGKPVSVYTSVSEGRNHLFILQKDFDLCPKLCGLQKVAKACFDYQINNCNGACIQKENADTYNSKVKAMIKSLNKYDESFIIIDKGRDHLEQSFVMVEDGIYKGYGYLGDDVYIEEFEEFKNYLIPQKHNKDIQRIIQMQLKKKRYRMIRKPE